MVIVSVSSLVMVPVPEAGEIGIVVLPKVAPVRLTVKVSSCSATVSPLIVTVRLTLVAPAAKATEALVRGT